MVILNVEKPAKSVVKFALHWIKESSSYIEKYNQNQNSPTGYLV